jgi:hypothetical protein
MSDLKRKTAVTAAALAIVGGTAIGLAGPASAAGSCPATVSNHFIGGGYYGAEWATGSSLVSSSTSGGYAYCTYYGTIHVYAGGGETTHGGSWSAYASQL